MADSPRIPSLVQYCQKVAAAHVENISGFGDDIPYKLVRPILEYCSTEALRRIEDASPHLKQCTEELWQRRCHQDLPLDLETYLSSHHGLPSSWRALYQRLTEDRAKKLEEAGSRLRNSRMDEEQRRKERDVKLTDKPLPMKKPRLWGAPVQQKTLFQKTRTEASRMQRIFDKQMRPLMPPSKSYRTSSTISPTKSLLPSPPSASLPMAVQANPHVLIRPVITRLQQQPHSTHTSPDPSSPPPPASAYRTFSASSPSDSPTIPSSLGGHPSPPETHARHIRSLPPSKKSSTTALFMPKHRAHSQLSDRLVT